MPLIVYEVVKTAVVHLVREESKPNQHGAVQVSITAPPPSKPEHEYRIDILTQGGDLFFFEATSATEATPGCTSIRETPSLRS